MRKELIVHQDPKSPISETFRTLRTNIQFMNTKGKLRSLLVTSTLPAEGKSWVSSNLAVTFAQAGRKVVLIDADMRKGRQYSIFGVSPRPGLSNYLSGVDDVGKELTEDPTSFIQETGIENLFVIAAGNVPPNPAELLITERMVNLLEQLKERFDIVIIDGTPSQLVTDSLILTRLVDTTLIVTASKQTKKEDLKRIIKNIENVGGKIAGVVVNKMPISTKKYEQAYYYGSTSLQPVKKTNRKANEQMYNRTSSMIKTQRTEKENSLAQNKRINDKPEVKKMKENPNKEFAVKNTEEISLERTTDILNQINQYLDEEKKKLK